MIGATIPTRTGASTILFDTAALTNFVLGDFNGNFIVDTTDYDTMRAFWGSTGKAFNEDGEVTGPGGIPDGIVDVLDFQEFKEKLFPGGAPAFASALASAVPEPSTAVLLLAAAPAWLLLRPAQRKGRSVKLSE